MRQGNDADHRLLMGIAEAAALAGLSKSAAYRLAAAGALPGLVRLPAARLLVRRRVLEAWLDGADDRGAGRAAPRDARPSVWGIATSTSGEQADASDAGGWRASR